VPSCEFTDPLSTRLREAAPPICGRTFDASMPLAVDNEDGTLDVYLLRPLSDRDDERALVEVELLE